MKRFQLTVFASIFTLSSLLINCNIAFPEILQKDIVLMIDNSGSMRKNDPNFLTKRAVKEFVENLSGDTQVAVLIFDHRIDLTVPLTMADEPGKERILASFVKINYRGQLTNIPSAMERSIYELNTNGREESQKSIIFITDGIVDTGDKARDLAKTRWLRENLAKEAADAGIRIFGIAFTDQADFELIQSLSQETGGTYFRAFTPEDIQGTFSRINKVMNRVKPEPKPEPEPEPVRAPPPPPRAAEPPTVELPDKTQVQPAPQPPRPQIPSKQEKAMPFVIIILAVLVVLVVAILLILIMLKRRQGVVSKEAGKHTVISEEYIPKAILKDVKGETGQSEFDITEKVTTIGRLAGGKGKTINDISIDKHTISRQHATIEYKNHSFWIIDLGSTNGTFLNGTRITGEARLKHGDTVAFYECEFEFIIKDMVQADLGALDQTVFREDLDFDATRIVSDTDEATPEKEPDIAVREESPDEARPLESSDAEPLVEDFLEPGPADLSPAAVEEEGLPTEEEGLLAEEEGPPAEEEGSPGESGEEIFFEQEQEKEAPPPLAAEDLPLHAEQEDVRPIMPEEDFISEPEQEAELPVTPPEVVSAEPVQEGAPPPPSIAEDLIEPGAEELPFAESEAEDADIKMAEEGPDIADTMHDADEGEEEKDPDASTLHDFNAASIEEDDFDIADMLQDIDIPKKEGDPEASTLHDFDPEDVGVKQETAHGKQVSSAAMRKELDPEEK